jgi:hypothetical protein
MFGERGSYRTLACFPEVVYLNNNGVNAEGKELKILDLNLTITKKARLSTKGPCQIAGVSHSSVAKLSLMYVG